MSKLTDEEEILFQRSNIIKFITLKHPKKDIIHAANIVLKSSNESSNTDSRHRCMINDCNNIAEQINTPVFSSGIYCRKHFDEINSGIIIKDIKKSQ